MDARIVKATENSFERSHGDYRRVLRHDSGAGDGNRTHVTSLEGSRFEVPSTFKFNNSAVSRQSTELERQPADM